MSYVKPTEVQYRLGNSRLLPGAVWASDARGYQHLDLK